MRRPTYFLKGARGELAEANRRELEEKFKNIRNAIRMAKPIPLGLKALQMSEGARKRKLDAAKEELLASKQSLSEAATAFDAAKGRALRLMMSSGT